MGVVLNELRENSSKSKVSLLPSLGKANCAYAFESSVAGTCLDQDTDGRRQTAGADGRRQGQEGQHFPFVIYQSSLAFRTGGIGLEDVTMENGH